MWEISGTRRKRMGEQLGWPAGGATRRRSSGLWNMKPLPPKATLGSTCATSALAGFDQQIYGNTHIYTSPWSCIILTTHHVSGPFRVLSLFTAATRKSSITKVLLCWALPVAFTELRRGLNTAQFCFYLLSNRHFLVMVSSKQSAKFGCKKSLHPNFALCKILTKALCSVLGRTPSLKHLKWLRIWNTHTKKRIKQI